MATPAWLFGISVSYDGWLDVLPRCCFAGDSNRWLLILNLKNFEQERFALQVTVLRDFIKLTPQTN